MTQEASSIQEPTPHEAARLLASSGYHVIPIKAGGKHPPIPDWWNAATTGLDTIDAWWGGLYARDGVGIATGYNGVFVLDVDVGPGKAGDETLKDLELLHGELPETVEQQTGSGGRHLFFRAPPGVEIRNSAGNRLGPGLDIRGVGGQVVCAPTIHPNGRPYIWLLASAPWEREVADAPGWLIGLLTRDDPPSHGEGSSPALTAPSTSSQLGQPPQPTSQGNDRPGDRFNQTTTWETLLTADGWTRLRNGPQGEQRWTRPGKAGKDGCSATVGWAGTDLLKVFTSSVPTLTQDATYSRFGYWAATRHHGDHQAAARAMTVSNHQSNIGLEDLIGTWTSHSTEPTSLTSDPATRSEVAIPGLARWLIDWPTFWTNDHDDTEWLLEPLLARGRGHALYAAAKSGKSLLLLEAAAAIATGRRFLGQPPGPPRSVLYVDYEMSQADLLERLDTMGYGPDTDLTQLRYVLLPSIPGLDTADGARYVVEAAITWGVELVIIDTTARAVEGEENSADTFRAFYRHLGLALKSNGITYVRADHAGKDAEKGQRGSSAKNDDVDVVWWYSRMEGGGRLEAKYRRMAWVPEKVDIRISDEPWLTHRISDEPSWHKDTKRVADDLDELGAPVDISKRDARALLQNAKRTASTEALNHALKYRKTGRPTVRPTPSDHLDGLIARPERPNNENAGQSMRPTPRPAAAQVPSVGAARPLSLESGPAHAEPGPRPFNPFLDPLPEDPGQ